MCISHSVYSREIIPVIIQNEEERDTIYTPSPRPQQKKHNKKMTSKTLHNDRFKGKRKIGLDKYRESIQPSLHD